MLIPSETLTRAEMTEVFTNLQKQRYCYTSRFANFVLPRKVSAKKTSD